MKKFEYDDSDLSELHDCDKCHDKMVGISVDKLGVQRCSYCNQVVDYAGWFKRKGFDKYVEELIKDGSKRNISVPK